MDIRHLGFAPYTSFEFDGIADTEWLTTVLLDEDEERVLLGLCCAKFNLPQDHLDFSEVPYVVDSEPEGLTGYLCFSVGYEGGGAFSEHFTLLVLPFNYELEDSAQVAWVGSGTVLERWRDHFFEPETCTWADPERRTMPETAVDPALQKLASEAFAKLSAVLESDGDGGWVLAEDTFDWFRNGQFLDGELDDFSFELGVMEPLWPYTFRVFQD